MRVAAVSQSKVGAGSGAKARLGRLGPWSILSVSLALAAGVALRLWMAAAFFQDNGDSLVYGQLAKTLLHGRYQIPNLQGVLAPTLIRLPGYPLFLLGCFRLFGVDRYYPPVVVQILCELAACLLLASVAARLSPALRRKTAFHAALWLACLCPFTAIYDATPLTESLTCFTIALALWAAVRFQEEQTWPAAICFTLAITYAALLRPDGALVGIAFATPMLLALFPSPHRSKTQKASTAGCPTFGASLSLRLGWDRTTPTAPLKTRLRLALVCLLIAVAPFAVWTVRNWRVMHVFQPLAPRYATDPGDPTWPGWQRWVKTWSLDFYTTYEIYWIVPDGPFDLAKLPARAIDSPAQRAETEAIAQAYEANDEDFTPEIDARFARLAAERIAAHPLRYYLVLPLGRVVDMLFRPRVENLPINLDWWKPFYHPEETEFSWFYAGLNLFYFLLAAIGLCLRPRLWKWMLLYFVLRCALLSTLEAAEARYTIEFFPLLFVLGGVAIARFAHARR